MPNIVLRGQVTASYFAPDRVTIPQFETTTLHKSLTPISIKRKDRVAEFYNGKGYENKEGKQVFLIRQAAI